MIKESSTSTKLRVVFDASCKTRSGISLNDCVMVGPTIQKELFDIIVRFRQHRFVLTGDVVKMYRQIWVKPEQRRLQCILWRNEKTQQLETFQLNTVTFGVASSPYLATRCLRQLAEDFESSHPQASRIIRDDFYVDDLQTGGQTEEEVIRIKDEVTAILQSAGFDLQKIYSNVEGLSPDNDDYKITEIKTLGLCWQPGDDRLRYRTSYQADSKSVITKRSILSIISQVYDPLGLIGPFTVRSKLLLQFLWKLRVNWDSPIPNDLKEKWLSHCEQLKEINNIDIPRYVLIESPQTIQIHGFCDASEVAYGACLYMRSTSLDGSTLARLICARSRVAPLKSTSLPRLELCGALLLATLFSKITEALTVKIDGCFFWSDSTIALAWIKSDSSRWQTFVSNRVAEIQRLTPGDKWNHVATDQNPADFLSRGMDARNLSTSNLWWKGPSWLQEGEDSWPQSNIHISDMPEQKKLMMTFAVLETKDFSILRRCSSWNKFCRVIAYCLRFAGNLRLKHNKEARISGSLSAAELLRARTTLLKLHQEEEFPRELHDLRRDQPIHHNSKLRTLNPFLDEEGLMRVGGRLTHAPLSYSQRFPIIMSKKHVLTEIIIRDCHYQNLHAGSQLLAATLRERYWIVSMRSAIRRVLSKCILCFRLKPAVSSQLMGNLPEVRVTPSRPFANVGLDYAGPFNIKISRNKTGKAYLCVFVCMAVKAVHLELVSDLTTNAFLNALKRFISRRGKCLTIMSDNGKNFIGAKNELQKIVRSLLSENESKEKIMNFVANNSIKWSFIPPYSPHMGGLWEAAVKSAKSHLKTVINDTPLTFEELYTVIVQIESILNSRPLCPLSVDINDLNVLTPGHFLIGTALNSILEEDVRDVPVNRTNRFQLLSRMQQCFWQRWSAEYVTQLQSRLKWKQKDRSEHVRVGRMVVIKDDNLPPLRWQLGRITEMHPGADGLTRIVSVRTASGIVKRSLPKICILPLDEKD